MAYPLSVYMRERVDTVPVPPNDRHITQIAVSYTQHDRAILVRDFDPCSQTEYNAPVTAVGLVNTAGPIADDFIEGEDGSDPTPVDPGDPPADDPDAERTVRLAPASSIQDPEWFRFATFELNGKKRRLFEYQIDAMTLWARSARAHMRTVTPGVHGTLPCNTLLAQGVGMGKTMQAAVAVATWLAWHPKNRVIVFSPPVVMRAFNDTIKVVVAAHPELRDVASVESDAATQAAALARVVVLNSLWLHGKGHPHTNFSNYIQWSPYAEKQPWTASEHLGAGNHTAYTLGKTEQMEELYNMCKDGRLLVVVDEVHTVMRTAETTLALLKDGPRCCQSIEINIFDGLSKEEVDDIHCQWVKDHIADIVIAHAVCDKPSERLALDWLLLELATMGLVGEYPITTHSQVVITTAMELLADTPYVKRLLLYVATGEPRGPYAEALFHGCTVGANDANSAFEAKIQRVCDLLGNLECDLPTYDKAVYFMDGIVDSFDVAPQRIRSTRAAAASATTEDTAGPPLKLIPKTMRWPHSMTYLQPAAFETDPCVLRLRFASPGGGKPLTMAEANAYQGATFFMMTATPYSTRTAMNENKYHAVFNNVVQVQADPTDTDRRLVSERTEYTSPLLTICGQRDPTASNAFQNVLQGVTCADLKPFTARIDAHIHPSGHLFTLASVGARRQSAQLQFRGVDILKYSGIPAGYMPSETGDPDDVGDVGHYTGYGARSVGVGANSVEVEEGDSEAEMETFFNTGELTGRMKTDADVAEAVRVAEAELAEEGKKKKKKKKQKKAGATGNNAYSQQVALVNELYFFMWPVIAQQILSLVKHYNDNRRAQVLVYAYRVNVHRETPRVSGEHCSEIALDHARLEDALDNFALTHMDRTLAAAAVGSAKYDKRAFKISKRVWTELRAYHAANRDQVDKLWERVEIKGPPSTVYYRMRASGRVGGYYDRVTTAQSIYENLQQLCKVANIGVYSMEVLKDNPEQMSEVRQRVYDGTHPTVLVFTGRTVEGVDLPGATHMIAAGAFLSASDREQFEGRGVRSGTPSKVVHRVRLNPDTFKHLSLIADNKYTDVIEQLRQVYVYNEAFMASKQLLTQAGNGMLCVHPTTTPFGVNDEWMDARDLMYHAVTRPGLWAEDVHRIKTELYLHPEKYNMHTWWRTWWLKYNHLLEDTDTMESFAENVREYTDGSVQKQIDAELDEEGPSGVASYRNSDEATVPRSMTEPQDAAGSGAGGKAIVNDEPATATRTRSKRLIAGGTDSDGGVPDEVVTPPVARRKHILFQDSDDEAPPEGKSAGVHRGGKRTASKRVMLPGSDDEGSPTQDDTAQPVATGRVTRSTAARELQVAQTQQRSTKRRVKRPVKTISYSGAIIAGWQQVWRDVTFAMMDAPEGLTPPQIARCLVKLRATCNNADIGTPWGAYDEDVAFISTVMEYWPDDKGASYWDAWKILREELAVRTGLQSWWYEHREDLLKCETYEDAARQFGGRENMEAYNQLWQAIVGRAAARIQGVTDSEAYTMLRQRYDMASDWQQWYHNRYIEINKDPELWWQGPHTTIDDMSALLVMTQAVVAPDALTGARQAWNKERASAWMAAHRDAHPDDTSIPAMEAELKDPSSAREITNAAMDEARRAFRHDKLLREWREWSQANIDLILAHPAGDWLEDKVGATTTLLPTTQLIHDCNEWVTELCTHAYWENWWQEVRRLPCSATIRKEVITYRRKHGIETWAANAKVMRRWLRTTHVYGAVRAGTMTSLTNKRIEGDIPMYTQDECDEAKTTRLSSGMDTIALREQEERNLENWREKTKLCYGVLTSIPGIPYKETASTEGEDPAPTPITGGSEYIKTMIADKAAVVPHRHFITKCYQWMDQMESPNFWCQWYADIKKTLRYSRVTVDGRCVRDEVAASRQRHQRLWTRTLDKDGKEVSSLRQHKLSWVPTLEEYKDWFHLTHSPDQAPVKDSLHDVVVRLQAHADAEVTRWREWSQQHIVELEANPDKGWLSPFLGDNAPYAPTKIVQKLCIAWIAKITSTKFWEEWWTCVGAHPSAKQLVQTVLHLKATRPGVWLPDLPVMGKWLQQTAPADTLFHTLLGIRRVAGVWLGTRQAPMLPEWEAEEAELLDAELRSSTTWWADEAADPVGDLFHKRKPQPSVDDEVREPPYGVGAVYGRHDALSGIVDIGKDDIVTVRFANPICRDVHEDRYNSHSEILLSMDRKTKAITAAVRLPGTKGDTKVKVIAQDPNWSTYRGWVTLSGKPLTTKRNPTPMVLLHGWHADQYIRGGGDWPPGDEYEFGSMYQDPAYSMLLPSLYSGHPCRIRDDITIDDINTECDSHGATVYETKYLRWEMGNANEEDEGVEEAIQRLAQAEALATEEEEEEEEETTEEEEESSDGGATGEEASSDTEEEAETSSEDDSPGPEGDE